MNLKALDWDDELLKEMNIPREMLPDIRPSSDKNIYGYTNKDGPFVAVIPVCGDLGDQQAALFGQTCFEVGEKKYLWYRLFSCVEYRNDAGEIKERPPHYGCLWSGRR
jgi:glycerol kinase